MTIWMRCEGGLEGSERVDGHVGRPRPAGLVEAGGVGVVRLALSSG